MKLGARLPAVANADTRTSGPATVTGHSTATEVVIDARGLDAVLSAQSFGELGPTGRGLWRAVIGRQGPNRDGVGREGLGAARSQLLKRARAVESA
jgi:hypothetical protein